MWFSSISDRSILKAQIKYVSNVNNSAIRSRKIVKLDPQTINITKDFKDVKKEKILNKNG